MSVVKVYKWGHAAGDLESSGHFCDTILEMGLGHDGGFATGLNLQVHSKTSLDFFINIVQ